MAHDHRMRPVGEPHLNARRLGSGRSDLPRLTRMLARQLSYDAALTTKHDPFTGGQERTTYLGGGWGGSNNSAFTPPTAFLEQHVAERLGNYRKARNEGSAFLSPSRHERRDDDWKITNETKSVAKELNNRLKDRELFSDY